MTEATATGIKRLAEIRLGAAVGVAALGGGAGALAGAKIITLTKTGAFLISATSFTHSVGYSLASTWEQGSQAKVVAIETGKLAASEGMGKVAANSFDNAVAAQAKSQQVMKSVEGQINKYTQRLAQDGLKKAQRRKATDIVARSTNRLGVEKQALERSGQAARRAMGAQIAVPLVFAAWDIWNAVAEYDETTQRL